MSIVTFSIKWIIMHHKLRSIQNDELNPTEVKPNRDEKNAKHE